MESLLADLVRIGVPSSDIAEAGRVLGILMAGALSAHAIQQRFGTLGRPVFFLFVLATGVFRYAERLSVSALGKIGFGHQDIYGPVWRELWEILPPLSLLALGVWFWYDMKRGGYLAN